ncbi:hypothetical protein SFRURICE_014041, partial [Spodoptera frugiperda]
MSKLCRVVYNNRVACVPSVLFADDICAAARSHTRVALETANLQFDDTTKGRDVVHRPSERTIPITKPNLVTRILDTIAFWILTWNGRIQALTSAYIACAFDFRLESASASD